MIPIGECIIWGDVLFLIDFSMDFLGLYTVLRLRNHPAHMKRMIPAAAFTAAFAVFLTAYPGNEKISVLLTILAGIVGCMIAVPSENGTPSEIFRTSLLFFLTEAAMGGIMTLFYRFLHRFFRFPTYFSVSGEEKLRLFPLAVGIFFLILWRITHGSGALHRQADGIYTLSAEICGKELHFSCFSDTGNLVREPISGLPVIFLPKQSGKISDEAMHGRRLIPLETVTGQAVVWGIKPDRLLLHCHEKNGKETTREMDAYLAFSDAGQKDGRTAVVPAVLLGNMM